MAEGFAYYVEQSREAPRRKYLRRRLGSPEAAPELLLDEAELVPEFGPLVSVHQVGTGAFGGA